MANPTVSPPIVNQSVSIADPNSPANVIKPNADGSINITGFAGTFEATTLVNTASPSYSDTQVKPFSATTAGALRVDLEQIGATNLSTGTGAQGAGTPRVTVATDTATIAGSAPGTLAAGSAPTNGVGVLGQYESNANQLVLTTGQTGSLQSDKAGNLRTAPQNPVSGDVLIGYQTFTSTTAATTVIIVPAGRTWVGTISANCSCAEVAAGTAQPQARAVFTTAGTGVVPAAGSYFAVDARNGANAASGLVGSGASNFGSTPFILIAPVGNTVTLQVASTNVGTASVVDATAVGVLQ